MNRAQRYVQAHASALHAWGMANGSPTLRKRAPWKEVHRSWHTAERQLRELRTHIRIDLQGYPEGAPIREFWRGKLEGIQATQAATADLCSFSPLGAPVLPEDSP